MGEQRATMECRFCRDAIDARAERCPHCRMPQTKWAFSFHPASVLVLEVLLFATLAALMFGVTRPFRKGADFTRYRDLLTVFDTHMIQGETAGGPTLGVAGWLRNGSSVTWEDVALEVQFFDRDGTLVDVATTGTGGNWVEPNGERAFRAECEQYLPVERYASFKVFVRSAKEARRLW